jgi:GAF domain-containing protein
MPDIFTQLRQALGRELPRSAKARLLAETIQESGNYHWVGLYDVGVTEIVAIAGLNGAAVASGKPVVVQDVTKDPRWLTTFGTTRAEAIFPVAGERNEVVGTLDVESDRTGAFGPADEALLTDVARMLRTFWSSESVSSIDRNEAG